MFVLDLARDNTERLPGDVPRYSATELATGEPPRPTVDVGKPIVRPNQGEMVAELVEEQIDVMRDQVLASAVRDPGEQHVVRDELLENADGVGDGFDDDPGGVGAAVGMPFVDGAAKGVPDDDAVVAEAAVVASSAQGLDLGVPGAGQKGDDDVAAVISRRRSEASDRGSNRSRHGRPVSGSALIRVPIPSGSTPISDTARSSRSRNHTR